ncbi:MAG: winged helix-turn-helix transcriptional regulator [Paludibacter sp.]|nr:winged helix-turn-helix transcriptional regulator [Paludibacter sp.]
MSKVYKNNKTNGQEPAQKVKISDLKFNVITPVNLSCILEPVELVIFIALLHQCNVSNKPISLSMIAGFTGLTKSRVSGNIKSLVKLGLIAIGRETKLGTYYYIEVEEIVIFLKDFNEIKDPVIRLQVGDLIRAFSGLETKNKSAIKLFAGYKETGVFCFDESLSVNNDNVFNQSIKVLNEFIKLEANNIWLTSQIQYYIAKRLCDRAVEIGEKINKSVELNEQTNEYYGK